MVQGYLNLTGPRRSALLALDAQVRAKLPLRAPATPEYQQALDAFRRSPLTGCATVLDLCRRKAGYIATRSDSAAQARFTALINSHPLFRDPRTSSIKFEAGPGPVDASQLVAKYKGTDPEASRRIGEQLGQVINAAVRSPGNGITSELLMEHSLQAESAITFYMGKSVATAAFVLMPGSMQFLMRVTGDKAEFIWRFDEAAWPAHAEATLKEKLTLVDDWLAQTG